MEKYRTYIHAVLQNVKSTRYTCVVTWILQNQHEFYRFYIFTDGVNDFGEIISLDAFV